jgi:hypothetical protein
MWMNCPGSVRLCAGIPNTPSKYTSLGTAAHELGERCLLDGTNAHDHLGEKITADGKPHPVDVDMADAVQVYIEEIRGDIIQALDLDLSVLDGKSVLAALEKSAMVFGVEARFHLEWLHPDLFGTNDANFGVPLDVLRVYDYKHGQGVAVEVEDNPQLKYYALGALGPDNEHMYEEVELVIVQPRCRHGHPVQRWRISVTELYEWARGDLLSAARATEDPNAPLIPGAKQCRWCRAEGSCPEVARMHMHTVAAAFGTPDKPEPVCDPVPPDLLTDKQLGQLNELFPAIESWIRSCKGEIEARLLRGADMNQINAKLVQKKAHRQWANEQDAQRLLSARYGNDVLSVALKSPAQVEKVVKALTQGKTNAPKRKEELAFMAQLIEVPDTGVTVAPLSDKRPAVGAPVTTAFHDELFD